MPNTIVTDTDVYARSEIARHETEIHELKQRIKKLEDALFELNSRLIRGNK